MKVPVRSAFALVLAVLALASARAETDQATPDDQQARAKVMLERMNSALRSLNYEGTLVYLLDNRLETLHLVHRVDEGRVQERLVSLSGPVRTVSRDRDGVTCVMPNGHPITVKHHGGRNLLGAERIDPKALAEHYRVTVLGSARVAGRDTDVIAIHPLDALRYGHQFHLDKATGLPLKSDLIDQAGDSKEQLMFTTLDLKPSPPPMSATESDSDPESADGAEARPATDWRFTNRPAGFEPIMHDRMAAPNGALVEHFVFSDRLSSYSIYIEDDSAEGLDGVTRIGAVHAAGRRVSGHQVTAVGEVPAATVEGAVAGVERISQERQQP